MSDNVIDSYKLNPSQTCMGSHYIKNRKTNESCPYHMNCFKYKRYQYDRDNNNIKTFNRVNDFRSCEDYKYSEYIEKSIILTAMYNILYVNDIACISVMDISEYINEQDKETKKIYGALKKRRAIYQNMINEIVKKEIYLLAEFNSNMDEYVQDKIVKLQSSILNELKRNDVENAKFISLCETARTLIGYSVFSVRNRIKDCLCFNKMVNNWRNYELSDMKRVAENLSDWASRRVKNIDFNKCTEIMESYRDLDKTLTNSVIINDCITRAKKYYYGD